MSKPTIEDLADSLDELFAQLAEQADRLEVLHETFITRDRILKQMLRHVERLVAEKEFLLKHIGLTELIKQANR